jgi:hypothetical protein
MSQRSAEQLRARRLRLLLYVVLLVTLVLSVYHGVRGLS